MARRPKNKRLSSTARLLPVSKRRRGDAGLCSRPRGLRLGRSLVGDAPLALLQLRIKNGVPATKLGAAYALSWSDGADEISCFNLAIRDRSRFDFPGSARQRCGIFYRYQLVTDSHNAHSNPIRHSGGRSVGLDRARKNGVATPTT